MPRWLAKHIPNSILVANSTLVLSAVNCTAKIVELLWINQKEMHFLRAKCMRWLKLVFHENPGIFFLRTAETGCFEHDLDSKSAAFSAVPFGETMPWVYINLWNILIFILAESKNTSWTHPSSLQGKRQNQSVFLSSFGTHPRMRSKSGLHLNRGHQTLHLTFLFLLGWVPTTFFFISAQTAKLKNISIHCYSHQSIKVQFSLGKKQ